MSIAAQDIEFARELFSDIPDLSTRKMFGGLGIYSDNVIFALMLSDGQIMLKARDEFAAWLAEMGAAHWTYARKNGAEAAMPYWSLPDAALDDPEMAMDLAREALAAIAG